MTTHDDAFDDEKNVYSNVPFSKNERIARFFKGLDSPDKYTFDVFYVDRTTGREVLRYDGADPANTKPYYGATTDGSCLASKNLDINELIDPVLSVISDQDLRAMCHGYYDYESDDYESDDYRDYRDSWKVAE